MPRVISQFLLRQILFLQQKIGSCFFTVVITDSLMISVPSFLGHGQNTKIALLASLVSHSSFVFRHFFAKNTTQTTRYQITTAP
jgi:hypothetical protein